MSVVHICLFKGVQKGCVYDVQLDGWHEWICELLTPYGTKDMKLWYNNLMKVNLNKHF